MRRHLLRLTLAFAALAVASTPGLAAYPDKPIRLIVPSAPGGAPDALMRVLATQLQHQMGVPFVVDNKPGAAYVIGTMELVHSPADGYTLAYGNVVAVGERSHRPGSARAPWCRSRTPHRACCRPRKARPS